MAPRKGAGRRRHSVNTLGLNYFLQKRRHSEQKVHIYAVMSKEPFSYIGLNHRLLGERYLGSAEVTNAGREL